MNGYKREIQFKTRHPKHIQVRIQDTSIIFLLFSLKFMIPKLLILINAPNFDKENHFGSRSLKLFRLFFELLKKFWDSFDFGIAICKICESEKNILLRIRLFSLLSAHKLLLCAPHAKSILFPPCRSKHQSRKFGETENQIQMVRNKIWRFFPLYLFACINWQIYWADTACN